MNSKNSITYPRRGKFHSIYPEPIELYENYLSIKLHFSGKYNYFKYNGRIKYKPNDVNSIFKTLAGKVTKENLPDFFVVGFSKNLKLYAEFLEYDYWLTFNDWIKRKESPKYFYEKDLSDYDIDEIIEIKNKNQLPDVLKLLISNKINFQTYIHLARKYDLFDYYNDNVKEKIIFKKLNKKIERLDPFIPETTF